MSERKIVTVLGATGNQGGSVVTLLLGDAALKTKYAVRAVTRDPTKASAKKLESAGAELVKADLDDVGSLKQIFAGAYAVFGVTNFWESMSKDKEVQQGKNIVDAAKEAGVKHLVWSSLPHATTISNGTLKHIQHFDGKSEVEQYAEAQKGGLLATSYFMPAFFMSNLKDFVKPGQDGNLAWAAPMDAHKTNVPLIDINKDTGKFVVGLLEAGTKKANGVTVHAVSQWATPDEVVKTLTDGLGKKVNFASVPADVFKGFLPPAIADELTENMQLIADYDYYGKTAKAEQAKSDAFLYESAGAKATLAQYIKESQPWAV